jgi:N-acetylgalactosamine-6-sulfatase
MIYFRLTMKPIAALLALVVSTLSLSAAPPSSKPNIVFILADDLGYGDLGCYGAKDIRTPRLDRLAREGVRFTQFYSNGPECSPTRTAFLTGRYQQRVGGLECAIGIGGVGRYDDAIRLAAKHELGLPATELTLPRLLRDAGYATAISGKWHLGYEDHFAPSRHGFDHALYCLGGGMDYFHHVEDPPDYAPVLRLNGAPLKRRGYATDLFGDEAMRWLRSAKQPFFLYLPFTSPHSPFQAPDEEQPAPLPADSERWKQGKAPPRVYAAMIERMDSVIGKLLDTLDELGAAKNTLVVFTSDNGGTASARPTGLRGIKGTTFEGGIRVPCIARWPGVVPAGVERTEPAATFDLTASFARAAGVKPPRPFDGVDILGAIARGKPLPSRVLFWRGRRGERTWRAVRDGALKYVSETDGPRVEEFLYDLGADPGEQKSLFAERSDDVACLKQKLAAWEIEVQPQR